MSPKHSSQGWSWLHTHMLFHWTVCIVTSHLPVLASSLDFTLIFVLHRLQAQLSVDPFRQYSKNLGWTVWDLQLLKRGKLGFNSPATLVRICMFSCRLAKGSRYSWAQPAITSCSFISTWLRRSLYSLRARKPSGLISLKLKTYSYFSFCDRIHEIGRHKVLCNWKMEVRQYTTFIFKSKKFGNVHLYSPRWMNTWYVLLRFYKEK